MSTQKDIKYVNKDGKSKKLFDVIDKNDFFLHNGKLPIIKLTGIKKLCDAEEIVEKNFRTEITPREDNKQQHAVNIWVGFKGDADTDNWRRGSGEASMLNTGEVTYKVKEKDGKKVKVRLYNEIGCIDTAYRFAMADKRAFSRAVLSILRLHNVYSEIEANDFVNSKQQPSEGDIQGHDY